MQNRVIFKILATGINFLLSLVLGIFVPNAIGPEAYGEFSYITSTFAFLLQFLMFTSSTAYIYFLSNGKYKQEEINTFYFSFLALISTLITIFSLFSFNHSFFIKYLWGDIQEPLLLLLGLILALLTNVQQRMVEFSDSSSQTIMSEKLKLFTKLLTVLSILGFIFFQQLNLYFYFFLSIINVVLFTLLFINYINFSFTSLSKAQFRAIFNDFYVYLKPLIIFTLVASVYSYLGKYVLQLTSGSIEQGYYNFALQLALIPVTFIASIMALYMSEMTKRFQQKNLNAIKDIFLNNIFKLYAIHATIAFFTIINANEIILLSVGESYIGATHALEALSIFSLLHTFGMLSGNLFLSTQRNKHYSQINSMIMLLGILFLTWKLFFTNGVNATQLAYIMTIFYALRVSIQLYVNLNYLHISKLKFLAELVLLSLVLLFILKVVFYLHFHLIINLMLSLFFIFVVNFLFKDYMQIRKLLRKL